MRVKNLSMYAGLCVGAGTQIATLHPSDGEAGDPLADWTIDNTIDTRDLLAYLNDRAAGCP